MKSWPCVVELRLAILLGAGGAAATAAGASGAAPPGSATPCALASMTDADRARASSRRCLACHDGSVMPAVAAGPGGTHPVDVLYASAVARDRRFAASPADPNLVLSGGRVTCATCHDRWAVPRQRWSLAVAPEALCRSCHLAW